MPLKISVKKTDVEKAEVDLAVLCLFDEELPKFAKSLDASMGNEISACMKSGEFGGKEAQITVFTPCGKMPAKKFMLYGIGKKEEFKLNIARNASANALNYARANYLKSVAFSTEVFANLDFSPKPLAQAIVEGALLGVYDFNKYKTEDAEDIKKREISELIILAKDGSEELQQGVETGECTANAVNLARDVANESANHMTPTKLSEIAKEVAKRNKLKCKILEKDEIEKMKMGGLLAVAQGSIEPPTFTILEYDSGLKEAETVAIIGKGITFDSGGISIKPSKDMEQMKYDKSGAAAVLGVLDAASALKLSVNIIGIIPATENLPSGSAGKPGDIITTLSGKTVEVINTDAEGRMILADAITYAVQKHSPKVIIDLATLTGACGVALGDYAIGALGNNTQMMDRVRKAGEISYERVWELPLWKEYDEMMKSDVADIKNVSNTGKAGTITGAVFLKKFVGETPWVHLDIASTAWAQKDAGYVRKGATAVGVRLLLQMFKEWPIKKQ
ncbi:MAG: leucyl aminopeptidase [Candidatus Micrarchaeota archaeon]